MAGELKNFDPDKVTATWAGTTIGALDLTRGLIDGPGAIVEAKAAGRWSEPRTDRQGNGARMRKRNRSGTLTFTYVAEAPIQDELTAIALADGETGTGTGVIVIQDLNSRTVITYTGCYIMDDPVAQFGDSAADRAYTFGYVERAAVFGGADAV